MRKLARLFVVSICGPWMLQAQDSTTTPTPRFAVLDKIIAKVDNQVLFRSDFDQAFLAFIQQERGFKIDQTRCKVLEQLITNKMLLAKAEIDSVVVDDKQVDAQLERRMEYFINQIGSKDKLEAYYGKSVTQLKAELRRSVKEQLVVQKMQDNITGKLKITPGEVKKFYNEIPKDSLPFFSKEFEIGHIVKYPLVSKDQKYVTRARLENIRKMVLQEGESFEKLAKQFSEDPISARAGGELGFFSKGELVPEYEAAALKLKPGELSPVVESQFGFHLIQLIERRGNEYNTRHILLKPVSSESDLGSAERYLDSIRTLIVSDSIKFQRAAKEHSDDKNTKETGGIITDLGANTTKILAENMDPVLMFMLDTMKVGTVSRPIPYRSDDGKEGYRIVYFKSMSEPHQANLKDDYQRIQQAALQEKKNKAINNWFNKTKLELYVEVDPEYKDCDFLKGLN